MQLPFGEWLPDLPDHVNPGATQARNVFPAVTSYRPFNNIAATSSNALTARCQGGKAFKSDSGVVSIFAGDATKLYKLTSNAFVDESGGTTFSYPAESYWDFIRFGEVVIAFNGDDAPQAWTLDSSTDKTKYNGLVLIVQPHGQLALTNLTLKHYQKVVLLLVLLADSMD